MQNGHSEVDALNPKHANHITTVASEQTDNHTDGEVTGDTPGQNINGFSKADASTSEGGARDGDSDRPNKKRKLDPATELRPKSRPASPPWKKAEAEGPTSFVVNGVRKSGRTNALPPELRPDADKRQTRGAGSRVKSAKAHTVDELPQNGTRARSFTTSTPRKDMQAQPVRKATPAAVPHFKIPTPKSSRKASDVSPYKPSPHSKSSSDTAAVARTGNPRQQTPLRRTYSKRQRTSDASSARAQDSAAKFPKYAAVNGTVAPPPNPFQRLKLVLHVARRNPKHYPVERKYHSFAGWLQENDFWSAEDGRKIANEEDARDEARKILKILDEDRPGGLLDPSSCSAALPPHQEEPPCLYGHWEYVAAHASHFQKLLRKEHDQHALTARRMAQSAVSEVPTNPKLTKIWARLRASWEVPLTTEEIEEIEREHQIKRYKQLVKDVAQRWALVKAEVDRIRLRKWEEEQQALGKQALDEMLEESTTLLKQRNPWASSDLLSDDEDDDDHEVEDGSEDGIWHSETLYSTEDGQDALLAHAEGEQSSDNESGSGQSDAEESDPDRMSTDESTDEGGGSDEDACLSVDALRAKYSKAMQNTPRSDSPGSTDESEQLGDTTASLIDGKRTENGDKEHSDPYRSPLEEEEMEDEQFGLKGSHDQSTIELDEVDPMLLDDSDDPSIASDDGTGTEDGIESYTAEDEEQDAADQVEDNPLWSFFSKKQREDIEEGGDGLKDEIGHDAHATFESVPYEQVNGSYSPKHHGTREMEPARPSDAAVLESGPAPQSVTNGSQNEIPSSAEVEGSQPSPDSTVDTPIPSLLRGTLREYQHRGLDWLAKLYAQNTNGILADEMGLGKTIQTIALLAHLAVDHEVWGPHLVVVPTSVMLNWEMEFKKWCPGFKILTYYGTQEERKKKRQGWMDDDRWNVVITSYQLILQDAQAFKKRYWHYLILDEAHNIKNFQTQRWQTLLTFKTHSRLLLTGTPLQNNLSELWSLLFFLMPSGYDGQGGFAELEKFVSAMRRPADQILDQGKQRLDAEAQEAVRKLHEVLRPYLLRRLKVDVEKQMPGKYEHVVYCRLSKRQRQLYDEFMGRADTKRTLASGNYMSIINCLMSLRKVCNHPDLFETRQIVTSFAMPRSAVVDYEIKELLVRRRLLAADSSDKISFDLLNLTPVKFECTSSLSARRTYALSALRPMEDLILRQSRRLTPTSEYDGSTIQSTLSRVSAEAQVAALDQLRASTQLTRLRMERRPIYGAGLVERLTLDISNRFAPVPPPRRDQITKWYLNTSSVLSDLVPSIEQRSASLETSIEKFGCTTPAAVASDMVPLTLTPAGAETVRALQQLYPGDPFHKARIRLSIAFPDKRLLQYDCGKLQRLAKLLQELQAGGHRALIFTQMTKVLDILEQFLNIHGHRYLRLDGATKIEQRQTLTDRFNNDPRILCFILSSRSGGLGINLTGADTVIFYDLDWNPAMDKQCQDRAHRIGQTRDVHIYRFVSEYTIEANILRKSNQKRLLDDVIIQKGEFTTDMFNRVSYRDAFDDGTLGMGEDTEASAAMERVLGDVTGLGQVLESVEDKEDAAAAKVAQREMSHIDDADFNESTNTSNTPKASVPPTPMDEGSGLVPGDATREDDEFPHVDDYMVRRMMDELRDMPITLPPDRRKRSRKARDYPHSRRRR